MGEVVPTRLQPGHGDYRGHGRDVCHLYVGRMWLLLDSAKLLLDRRALRLDLRFRVAESVLCLRDPARVPADLRVFSLDVVHCRPLRRR